MVIITRTLRKQDFIGARIHGAIREPLEEFKEKTDKQDSQVVREALSSYLSRHTDVKMREPIKKMREESEDYKEALAEDYFLEKQNFILSTKLKELTFLEYMDKNLSAVYLANKPHVCEKDLKEMLRTTLNTLKTRAEHHGFKEQWERRKEEPIIHVKEFLERQSLEEKAFNDFKDFMG